MFDHLREFSIKKILEFDFQNLFIKRMSQELFVQTLSAQILYSCELQPILQSIKNLQFLKIIAKRLTRCSIYGKMALTLKKVALS